MKTTIQTSRGPVRFHSVGEPIEGIPADIGNPAKNEQDSLIWKMKYAKSKIALLPAFGDSIGKDVSKAELALANIYIGEAAKTVSDLLAAAIAALTIVNREQPDGSIAADLLNAIRKATKGAA